MGTHGLTTGFVTFGVVVVVELVVGVLTNGSKVEETVVVGVFLINEDAAFWSVKGVSDKKSLYYFAALTEAPFRLIIFFSLYLYF